MKLKITTISDTHSKHNLLNKDLPGGDLLIFAGDYMNTGYYKNEAISFFEWFDSIDNYETKIMIDGNHDRMMENETSEMKGLLTGYKTIEHLLDDELVLYYDGPNGEYSEDNIRIYGSPWQPEFNSWAFNLPRSGKELQDKWNNIPSNTDILITHGPPFGYLDIPGGSSLRVGCELLRYRVDEIKPKINVFGHIHGSAGYYFNGHTHFINASVLNESYIYTNLPLSFEWNSITNEIEWL